MGGVLKSRCVGRVYGADGAVHHAYKATDGWDMSATLHQAGLHNDASETCK
jgi:hypothetical protein